MCLIFSFKSVLSLNFVVSASQCVCFSILLTFAVHDHKVVLRQGLSPPSLAASKLFCSHKVLQSFVICVDLDAASSTLELRALLVQGSHNSKHLLIVDLVVAFSRGHGFREVGNWVLLSIRVKL